MDRYMYLAHHKLHSFFTHRSETPYLFITGRVSSFNLAHWTRTLRRCVCVCVYLYVCVCGYAYIMCGARVRAYRAKGPGMRGPLCQWHCASVDHTRRVTVGREIKRGAGRVNVGLTNNARHQRFTVQLLLFLRCRGRHMPV